MMTICSTEFKDTIGMSNVLTMSLLCFVLFGIVYFYAIEIIFKRRDRLREKKFLVFILTMIVYVVGLILKMPILISLFMALLTIFLGIWSIWKDYCVSPMKKWRHIIAIVLNVSLPMYLCYTDEIREYFKMLIY